MGSRNGKDESTVSSIPSKKRKLIRDFQSKRFLSREMSSLCSDDTSLLEFFARAQGNSKELLAGMCVPQRSRHVVTKQNEYLCLLPTGSRKRLLDCLGATGVLRGVRPSTDEVSSGSLRLCKNIDRGIQIGAIFHVRISTRGAASVVNDAASSLIQAYFNSARAAREVDRGGELQCGT